MSLYNIKIIKFMPVTYNTFSFFRIIQSNNNNKT